jgi:PAS domain S-box-containing protein
MVDLGATVLIADDTEASRYSLRRTLEHAGFGVREAVNAAAALREAARNPDLIILDVNLPDRSGYEVCEILKANPKTARIPILHVSASFQESDNRSQGLERGADGYLTYPVEPRELIANVHALLRARRAEQLAVAYAQHWQTTFDAMRNGVALLDANGEILRCNRALGRLVGRPIRELLGRSCHDLFQVSAERSPFTRMKESGARETIEVSSEGWWLQIVADPFIDGSGTLGGAVYIVADETSRHQAEEELQRRAERLLEMDRRKDEFLAMLAHELRNPLGPIRNAVELLRISRGDTALAQRSEGIIARQVTHMARLVDDLLDVSRITRGRIQLRRQPIDLASLVQSVVATLKHVLEERKHTFELRLERAPMQVLGDPTRLEQVIANLLHNAAKYTDPGGHITLTLSSDGDEALVEVRDNGIGLTPEARDRVFEMFMQVDRSLARSQGGLGIGLTLARTLVEMHGGSITVASEGAGTGSVFTVRLPLLKTTVPAPNGVAASNGTTTTPARRRVLVVEDNIDSAQTLATLLTLHGHEVQTAYEGLAALAAAETFHPDVVLLDIGLPGMDGYEVARELRRRNPTGRTILVALTGYGQESDRRAAEEAGFDRHFVKPMPLDMLWELLDSM